MEHTESFWAGFNDCTEQAIAFLLENEEITMNHPIIHGLKQHLTEKQSELKLNGTAENVNSELGDNHSCEDQMMDTSLDEGYNSMCNIPGNISTTPVQSSQPEHLSTLGQVTWKNSLAFSVFSPLFSISSSCHTAQNSTHTPRNNAYTSRNSTHTAQNSTHTAQNSTHTVRNSAHTTHNSAHTAHDSVHTAHNSAHTTHNNAHTAHNSAHTAQNGTHTARNSAHTAHNSAHTAHNNAHTPYHSAHAARNTAHTVTVSSFTPIMHTQESNTSVKSSMISMQRAIPALLNLNALSDAQLAEDSISDAILCDFFKDPLAMALLAHTNPDIANVTQELMELINEQCETEVQEELLSEASSDSLPEHLINNQQNDLHSGGAEIPNLITYSHTDFSPINEHDQVGQHSCKENLQPHSVNLQREKGTSYSNTAIKNRPPASCVFESTLPLQNTSNLIFATTHQILNQ